MNSKMEVRCYLNITRWLITMKKITLLKLVINYEKSLSLSDDRMIKCYECLCGQVSWIFQPPQLCDRMTSELHQGLGKRAHLPLDLGKVYLMKYAYGFAVLYFIVVMSWVGLYDLLTHWGRDKMAAIFQTIFSNAFSWMKMYEFQLRFHWRLF